MVDTEIVEKTVEKLDFEPPCGWTGCENSADYFVKTKCCGADNLLCREHLMQIVREWHEQIGFPSRCAHCSSELPENIHDWINVKPIKK